MENSQKVKKNKVVDNASTQVHLPFSEIHSNMVVLKNGGLRAVLSSSAINFNLKSEEEQNAIIFSYQSFLNTLDFPVQILVKSQRLDIDFYLDKLRIIADKQKNDLMRKQTFDYMEYIQRLVDYAYIMEKKFYIIVPFDPYRSQSMNFFQKFFARLRNRDTLSDMKTRKGEFEQLLKGIAQRVQVVKGGLENCGLKLKQLETKELIKFYYQVYNPQTSRNQKIEDLDDVDIQK